MRQILILVLLFILTIFVVQFFWYRFQVTRSIDLVSIPASQSYVEAGQNEGGIGQLIRDELKNGAGALPKFTQSRQITLETFWVDACQVPYQDVYTFVAFQRQHDPASLKDNAFSKLFMQRLSGKHAPAQGITFNEAVTYCEAKGGRLPSLYELEALIKESESGVYPWGDSYEDRLVNSQHTKPVIQHCAEMAIAFKAKKGLGFDAFHPEWAVDQFSSPVIKGVLKDQSPALFSLASAYQIPQSAVDHSQVGFRCVYDHEPKQPKWAVNSQPVYIANKHMTIGLSGTDNLPTLLSMLDQSVLPLLSELFLQKPQSIESSMKGEVSVEQFEWFLKDPFVQLGFYANKHEPKGVSYQPLGFTNQLNDRTKPVKQVNWWAAYAFANWIGGRLPTENEWVYLYSNGLTSLYPGDHSQGKDANLWGVESLSGGLSEWTSTFQPSSLGPRIVVKGGNYLLPKEKTTSWGFALYLSPNQTPNHTGFRVVF